MGGGGDTPEQKPSAQEIEQARNAANRWNERFYDGYLELEKQALADSRTDHSQFMGAQASADLAQQEHEGLRQVIGAGGSNRDLASFGNVIAEAETTQDVDVAQQARTLKDTRMLDMAKVGDDVAANTSSGLRQAASLGASRASNEVENKVLVDNAKFAAKVQAASGLVNGSGMRAEGYRINKSGIQKTHEKGLGGGALKGKELEDSLAKEGNNLNWWQIAGSTI